MPTPQLRDYLRRLHRDAGRLIACKHPECAAYRQSLIEQIEIVVRLIENPQKTAKLGMAPKNIKVMLEIPGKRNLESEAPST